MGEHGFLINQIQALKNKVVKKEEYDQLKEKHGKLKAKYREKAKELNAKEKTLSEKLYPRLIAQNKLLQSEYNDQLYLNAEYKKECKCGLNAQRRLAMVPSPDLPPNPCLDSPGLVSPSIMTVAGSLVLFMLGGVVFRRCLRKRRQPKEITDMASVRIDP